MAILPLQRISRLTACGRVVDQVLEAAAAQLVGPAGRQRVPQ
jgi:hypothetical protein